MNDEIRIPLSAKIVRLALRSGLRGRTRFTLLLAKRIKSLQAVPVRWDDLPPLYLDLRMVTAHEMLTGTIPEQIEQRLVSQLVFAGEVVWDIGAYMGYYSLLFSRQVGVQGKVCSFEPNREVWPALRRTLDSLENVSLYPFALADESREANLIVPLDPSMSSLKDWTNGVVGKTHQVTCELKRLDDLVAARTIPLPDFVKCDVEGAELSVFRGAQKSLDRIEAPFVFFEANANSARAFGEPVSAAMDFLSGLTLPRYEFFEITDNGHLMRIERPNPMHSNILAVPGSRASRALLSD
jgi:FkbM family methyltransferase